jgi:hypothetical protein
MTVYQILILKKGQKLQISSFCPAFYEEYITFPFPFLLRLLALEELALLL